MSITILSEFSSSQSEELFEQK